MLFEKALVTIMFCLQAMSYLREISRISTSAGPGSILSQNMMFKGKIFNKIKYKEISNLRYYNLETIMGL
jgi:hypothetical protein